MSDRHQDPSHKHGELNEVRNAWQALTPPAQRENLEDTDPETRASVEWVRGAYSQSTAPAVDRQPEELDAESQATIAWIRSALAATELPSVPLPRRTHSAQSLHSHLRLVVGIVSGLAAAGLLALLLDSRSTDTGDAVVTPESQQPNVIAQGPSATAGGEPDRDLVAQAQPAGLPAELRDGHIEMRSGPVRLVLLTGKPKPSKNSDTETPTR